MTEIRYICTHAHLCNDDECAHRTPHPRYVECNTETCGEIGEESVACIKYVPQEKEE